MSAHLKSRPLLTVTDLKKHFPVRKRILSRASDGVRAVDGVSFVVDRRETVGLVGESGCGKTTVGRTLLRLTEPTGGSASFDGLDLFHLGRQDLAALRRRMQIIFQDPYASLDPRMTVRQIVGEGLEVHRIGDKGQRSEKVEGMIERVGLQRDHLARYAHEFSGGQRQRIGIARALILHPDFVVCDEAVSALDVSIQAQIINLLEELQGEMNLAYLFIAHDLGVVRHICDRVLVMYFGRIVETARTAELFANPVHPYTQALLSAMPRIQPRQRRERILWPPGVTTPEEARARIQDFPSHWRDLGNGHGVLEND